MIMKRSILLLVSLLLAFGIARAQTVYLPNNYHGPFIAAGTPPPIQFLGHYFELPTVTAVGANVTWTKGVVYVGPGTSGGYQIAASTGSGVALDASQTSCTPPLFTSCDIALAVPYEGITGTITGTFTAGEKVTQGTSNAIAYALNAATGTGALYLSGILSGTPDATHTWTGASSGATLASPSGIPASPGTVIVATNAGLGQFNGVYPLAYITTNASHVALSVTYPYQFTMPRQHALLVGFCSGTVGSAATDYVFPLGGSAVACSSNTTASVGAPVTAPGVLTGLQVKDGTAPGSTLTGVWTVLVNGSATTITCTITGTATTCTDYSHYALVSAGDLVTISDATGTSSAEAAPTVSIGYFAY